MINFDIDIEKINELIEIEHGVLDNENIWLLGSTTNMEIRCHKANIKEHLGFLAALEQSILDIRGEKKLNTKKYLPKLINLLERQKINDTEYIGVLTKLIAAVDN